MSFITAMQNSDFANAVKALNAEGSLEKMLASLQMELLSSEPLSKFSSQSWLGLGNSIGLIKVPLTPALFLDALTAHCCRTLKEEREKLSPDGCRKLLILWQSLRNEASKEQNPAKRDDSRWAWHYTPGPGHLQWEDWPAEFSKDTDAAKVPALELEWLLGGIDAESGDCYPVFFPVARDRGILEVQITALKPSTGWPTDWPNLVVAPWSVITLAQENMTHLRKLLHEIPGLLKRNTQNGEPHPRFLVEFRPAPTDDLDLRPNGLVIEGNSLDLAVCLAAWAVNQKRNLRRLCVSGEVASEWTETLTVKKPPGTIKMVNGLDDKLSALKAVAGKTKNPFVFVVPNQNAVALISTLGQHELITINGRRGQKRVLAENLKELVEDHADLLTDCYDDYRQAVQRLPTGCDTSEIDIDGFAASAVGAPSIPHFITCAGFDDNPIPLATQVVCALIRQIEKAESENQGATADLPVPFNFPLEKWPVEQGQDLRALRQSVNQTFIDAAEKWKELASSFVPDDIFKQMLLNTIAIEPHKLWPVVFCGNSLKMLPYDEIERRLSQLRTVMKCGPIIFVASDYHHEQMMRSIVQHDTQEASVAAAR